MVQFPVTTRKYDVEHYEQTGEIKYLDEEGETMPNMDARENAKKMREEITTLAQFNGFENYTTVAKKYHVSVTTAHAHMMHLRHEAEKEAKTNGSEIVTTEIPISDENEQSQTETASEDFPEVVLEPEYNLKSEDEIEDCDKKDILDSCEDIHGGPALSNDALERLITDLEAQWKKPELEKDIEKLKNSIITGIMALHKMFIYQAEMEFQAWIMEVVEEC